jgi:tetratricopeptide (TPR) repeat protein
MEHLDSETRETLFTLYREGAFLKLSVSIPLLLAKYPHESVLPSLMGAAQMELGDYQSALEYYQRALKLKPGFEKLLNSLGICYLKLERFNDALTSFESALKQNPEFSPAWFNMGLVYENTGQWSRAVSSYEQAVAIDDQYFDAFTSLGLALWRCEQYQQVPNAFTEALRCKPDHVPAHRNLLSFLERSVHHEKLRRQIEFATQHLGEHYLVALYKGILTDIDGDTQSARIQLEAISLEPANEAELHDERQRLARLTRLCDRLDDAEGSIRFAGMANDISRKLADSRGVVKDTFLNFVKNRETYFGGNYSELSIYDSTSSSVKAPVFIIGFPRSGTTLLDTILRGHPEVEIVEESDAVPRLIVELSGESDEDLNKLATLSAEKIERLRQYYFSVLQTHMNASTEDRLLIDRFAANIIYAGEIHRIFPDARFILMLRHPADCVLSCYSQTFFESSLNSNFFSLDECAKTFDRIFSLWNQYTQVLDLDVMTVKYEDLISDTEGTCRKLLSYLGLDWYQDMLDHQRTANERSMIKTVSYDQVTQPLYRDASGRWQRYRVQLQPVLEKIKPWVEQYDYRL